MTKVNTSSVNLRWLHEHSGLTWAQLAQVFGVSRHAVHMWANGGRMSTADTELLAQLITIVDALPSTTPQIRRTALLDAFRRPQAAYEHAINGPGFAPDQLLGTHHDRGDLFDSSKTKEK